MHKIYNLRFDKLSLSPEILKSIADMGFEKATEIQYKAIPKILEGFDIIGQAQTGTGKTAAFALPILEMTNPQSKTTTSLIVCPTRELALQISNEMQKMASNIKGLNIVTVYGGDDIQRQIRFLKKGAQIVVGTAGRIKDLLNRGELNFRNVEMVVLDEADEMLNMGFKDDIIEILSTTPSNRQTVLFSATLPKAILDITHEFLTEPIHIKALSENITATTIEQVYMNIGDNSKVELLLKLMDLNHYKLALAFCNTKRKADEIVMELSGKGARAEALHGDLTQAQRNKVMQKFREANFNILVATDVAARGIDVNNVDAVFNVDVPFDYEYYVHRIGRTGRAGKLGKAFSFIGGRNEMQRLKEIERYIKTEILREQLPTEKDLVRSHLNKYKKKLLEINLADNKDFYDEIMQDIEQDNDFDDSELAQRLLRLIIPLPKKSKLEVPKNLEERPRETINSKDFGKQRTSDKSRSFSKDKSTRTSNKKDDKKPKFYSDKPSTYNKEKPKWNKKK